MSRLYYSENGHVIPALCEELADYRRARKLLSLPSTVTTANLYLLARAYPGCSTPLRIKVNGVEQPALRPASPDLYLWYTVPLSAGSLVAGENVFEFWTDSPAMNTWSLALEGGHSNGRSYLSTDGGLTWRNEKMGYSGVLSGEYSVRVRLAERDDPLPPPLVWEDPSHLRLWRIRQMLPEQALAPQLSELDRLRSLLTWVCTRWEYRCGQPIYAPWDPETIFAWGQARHGAAGLSPTVMCVHFGVSMVAACLAAGLPARCAVFTNQPNGTRGHFCTEVWLEEFHKWVFVDPTLDAILFDGDTPLSVKEIQQAAGDLSPLVRWGAGRTFQDHNPFIPEWVEEVFLPGICFRHRSIWARNDFLSHLELTPPGHGTTSYCETGLIWELEDMEAGFGMFPNFLPSASFDLPPEGFPGGAKPPQLYPPL